MIHRRRLGLRARLTLIYALGALILSSTVATASFVLTQRRLLSETELTARSQLYGNVRDLRRGLQALPEIPDDLPSNIQGEDDAQITSVARTVPTPTTARTTTTRSFVVGPPTTDDGIDLPPNLLESFLGTTTTTIGEVTTPPIFEGSFGETSIVTREPEPEPEPAPAPPNPITSILENLQRPNGAQSLLIIPPASDGSVDTRQFSLSGLQAARLPADLVRLVINGQPAQRRFDNANGEPRLAIGIRLAEYDAEYYELVPLTDLADTLGSLRNILFGVALVAAAAGAGLGYYSAYRAVQPLNRVSAAAQAISEGDFNTRLDDQIDPDLRRLTTSFNQMVEALQRRIERDEQFASDVSHELRSPLMTLTASVGVLEGRRADLPAPARQAVDLLSKDVRRFQRLVEDLLEISRMDVGAIKLDMHPVFLSEFLRFVIAQSRWPDIVVESRPEDVDLLVSVDKRRMAQAITNLLDNAHKYAGGASSVAFARTGDVVQIYVDDRGPGVRPEDRLRIFDRFTRAGSDAGRRDVAKGVGLGLSLVSEHIRLHGGRVWVTDRPKGSIGARFVIELPVDDTVMAEEEMAT